MKVTRKKLKVEAAQRNQELRLDWQFCLQEYHADQLIFVDEMGSDDRTGDRSYGWSDKGLRAVVSRWLQRKKRVSVLPAYTVDGYIVATTFPGTCTAEIFEDFIIDQLLPHCSPFPGPRSVIVMDNASVHHKQINTIERAAGAAGVLIQFLPPYSPDFNPIEESFSVLKSFIRRRYHIHRRRFDSYQEFLEWAVRKCGSGASAAGRARAHFRHAGIPGAV